MRNIKNLVVLIIALSLIKNYATAQENADTIKYWKTGGFTALQLNQVSLTNWAKGGESSLSATGFLNLFATYKKDDLSFENTLDLGYGIIKTEDNPVRKNEDKIDFSSKFGYKAFGKFFYTALLNFKSQFDYGYKYPDDTTIVSKFFSPAYLIISLGMDYQASENLSIYFSPATGRFVFVLDDSIANKGTYTSEPAIYDEQGKMIEEGKKLKPEFGLYFKSKFSYELIKNVSLTSMLDLFCNYTDKVAANRWNFDVNWENTIVMKVNEFISANIFVHLIYDHDIKVPIYETINGEKVKVGEGPRTQLKETLGIGFSYKF